MTTQTRTQNMRTGTGSIGGAMQTTEAQEHSEGIVARTIEQQTAKLPSDVFLWAAGASMAVSLFFKISNKPHEALFVGQWAAPFLILGLYNKIVKVAGSDRVSHGTEKVGA